MPVPHVPVHDRRDRDRRDHVGVVVVEGATAIKCSAEIDGRGGPTEPGGRVRTLKTRRW